MQFFILICKGSLTVKMRQVLMSCISVSLCPCDVYDDDGDVEVSVPSLVDPLKLGGRNNADLCKPHVLQPDPDMLRQIPVESFFVNAWGGGSGKQVHRLWVYVCRT